ncbi:DapH/DapD/GlmU-related protein [Pseudomonas putida]|uniref:CatB-related O-acetyltransferase n=1 Tax=Pseudomonas putida TaxID=303 RepID=A0A8I1JQ76_PSEPU|nr:DapH/DapD/GlmU-related protein [Pseudomonas putida]MBI6888310.1 hypothetical protein [Pseudomonas putida]
MGLDVKFAESGIVGNPRTIKGDGFLEESAVINGNLNARFFVGAYSLIDSGSFVKNAFIGRFSTIEKGVQVGYNVIKEKNFSNHFFSRNLPFQGSDNYYKKIKTSRYYFEQNKYTFIGSDVLVGKGAVIQEGVVIGDGAIIHPNAYVTEDIPPYAIVSGAPARVLGYRFDAETVKKLISSEWWLHDISSLVSKYRSNAIDYHDNNDFIESLAVGGLPKLSKKIFYVNTDHGVFEENAARNMIVGPSHIERWYLFSQKGQVDKPEGYHLFPIPALSIFSAQLRSLVDWWTKWFDNVVLFVPDFRIGNVAVDLPIKDGRLVKPEAVSDDNSRKCYALALEALDYYVSTKNVRLWFWCLNGREEFNKKNGQYLNERGDYRHPIWNYQDLLEMYGERTIDIRQHFEGVLDFIVDGSIHPTNECYAKMAKIFERLNW